MTAGPPLRAEGGALPLTALLITWNEEANLARTLEALTWLPRILVIDSGSTDRTLAILAALPQVEVIQRPFDSFAEQCNFGLQQIRTPWVLSLDADYVVPPELERAMPELLSRAERTNLAGYSLPFAYCIDGQPLRGTLLPPRTCLYRVARGRYRNEGHGHRLQLQGEVARLPWSIRHDDRKPLQRWLQSQQRYLAQEAASLLATPSSALSRIDRLRKHTPLAPLAALLFCLLVRGNALDGRAGFTYALQRAYAELLLLLFLRDQRQPAERTDPAEQANYAPCGSSLVPPLPSDRCLRS